MKAEIIPMGLDTWRIEDGVCGFFFWQERKGY